MTTKKKTAHKVPATVATLTIAAGTKSHSVGLTKDDVDRIAAQIPRDEACSTGKKFLAALGACGLLPAKKYVVSAEVEAVSMEEARRIAAERFGKGARVEGAAGGVLFSWR